MITPTDSPFITIQWDGSENCCMIIDQTLLPNEEKYLSIRTAEAMWEAIKKLRVRGAPAIGVAGAYGVYLGVDEWRRTASNPKNRTAFFNACTKTADYLNSSRPTAVNLTWATAQMVEQANADVEKDVSVEDALSNLLELANRLHEEDGLVCERIGQAGDTLLESGMTVLTHCNAGGLATTRLGTALAPIIIAHQNGKNISVFADETRPLLQGARLTTWELMKHEVPVTLVCDNMAASIIASGKVQAVIVGTDRTAANGDVCNKIGTFGVALAAKQYGVPFYVAAPTSSIDMSLPTGADIPIEERTPDEITDGFGRSTAPEGVDVYNPAFDVTPADMVTALITEKGIVRQPLAEGLKVLFKVVDEGP